MKVQLVKKVMEEMMKIKMPEVIRKDAWPLEIHQAATVVASWDEKSPNIAGEFSGAAATRCITYYIRLND